MNTSSSTLISKLPVSNQQTSSQSVPHIPVHQSHDQQSYLQTPPDKLNNPMFQNTPPNQNENIQIHISTPSWQTATNNPSHHNPYTQQLQQQQQQQPQQQPPYMNSNPVSTQKSNSIGLERAFHQQSDQSVPIPPHQLQSIMNTVHGDIGNSNTSLPSRDIPKDQTRFTHDEQTISNHVPIQNASSDNTDILNNSNYIEQNELLQQSPSTRQLFMVDEVLDNIYVPIILGILFFIFQQPAIKSKLYLIMPTLFVKEGKSSKPVILIQSILFAGAFVCLHQFILYILSMK